MPRFKTSMNSAWLASGSTQNLAINTSKLRGHRLATHPFQLFSDPSFAQFNLISTNIRAKKVATKLNSNSTSCPACRERIADRAPRRTKGQYKATNKTLGIGCLIFARQLRSHMTTADRTANHIAWISFGRLAINLGAVSLLGWVRNLPGKLSVYPPTVLGPVAHFPARSPPWRMTTCRRFRPRQTATIGCADNPFIVTAKPIRTTASWDANAMIDRWVSEADPCSVKIGHPQRWH